MEYYAIRGVLDPALDGHTQRFDVRKDVDRGLVVAAVHDACVENYRKDGAVHQLFELRANVLVQYILDALGPKPAALDMMKLALEAAFRKVDEEVKRKAEELSFEWPEVLLATRFNSVVVIVHDGWVFTAGTSDAILFLSRDSKPFYLTSNKHQFHRYQAILFKQLPDCGKDEPTLYYFNQERLQDGDEFLAIGSRHLWSYLHNTDDMLPVLQSRIDVEGLEEACKSIVGRLKDRSKVLIVITLQEDAHKPKDPSNRLRLDDKVLEELLNTEWCYIDDPDDFVRADPLRYLLPYVNGKKQHPEPQLSSEYNACLLIQESCQEDQLQISSSLHNHKHKLAKPSVHKLQDTIVALAIAALAAVVFLSRPVACKIPKISNITNNNSRNYYFLLTYYCLI